MKLNKRIPTVLRKRFLLELGNMSLLSFIVPVCSFSLLSDLLLLVSDATRFDVA